MGKKGYDRPSARKAARKTIEESTAETPKPLPRTEEALIDDAIWEDDEEE
jgi:hypothetical protein